MNPSDEQLCVKGLASALGVSVRYVYEMRRCGFPMEGRRRDNQTSTVTAATQWIHCRQFRVVHGRGKVG